MAGTESKKSGTGRKLVAADLSTEISYFAWKRGAENSQSILSLRPTAPRTA